MLDGEPQAFLEDMMPCLQYLSLVTIKLVVLLVNNYCNIGLIYI